MECTNGNAELTLAGKTGNLIMVKAVDKAIRQNEKSNPNPFGCEICTKNRKFEEYLKKVKDEGKW